MPQLPFWVERHPTAIRFECRADLTEPEGPSLWSYTIEGQRGVVITSRTVRVPANVVHEEVLALQTAAWEAYLFGEVEQVWDAVRRVARAWHHEAARRPLWE